MKFTDQSARPALFAGCYRGTFLMRNRPLPGPYNSICLGPYGGPGGMAVSYE